MDTYWTRYWRHWPLRRRLVLAAVILTVAIIPLLTQQAGAQTAALPSGDTATSSYVIKSGPNMANLRVVRSGSISGPTARLSTTAFTPTGCASATWTIKYTRRLVVIYVYKVVQNWCWDNPANRIYNLSATGYFASHTIFTYTGATTVQDYWISSVQHRSIRGQILKNCPVKFGCVEEFNPTVQSDVFDYGGNWFVTLSH